MTGPVQNARLPDGTVVTVDAKTAYTLGMLQNLAETLARGQIDVLFLAWDGPEADGNKNHSMAYFNRPDRLLEMSELLQSQSKRLPQLASLWEGNMPEASRSFRVQ
jgi:hypothetical protein